VEYHPYRFAVIACGLALAASFGCAMLIASIGDSHTTKAAAASRLGVWLRAAILGVVAFGGVFMVLPILRAKFDWPPASTPEMLLFRPAYEFGLWAYSSDSPRIKQAGRDVQDFFDRHRGRNVFILEGVITWSLLGIGFGLGLTFLPRFSRAGPLRQLFVLLLAAVLFLILSRIMFPTIGIGYV
jgi:hypothetical protein